MFQVGRHFLLLTRMLGLGHEPHALEQKIWFRSLNRVISQLSHALSALRLVHLLLLQSLQQKLDVAGEVDQDSVCAALHLETFEKNVCAIEMNCLIDYVFHLCTVRRPFII